MKGPITTTILIIIFLTGTHAHNNCEERLPQTVDKAICERIHNAVLALHDAVKDVDDKVRSTVVGFMEEAREIVKSDTNHLKETLPAVLQTQATKTKPAADTIPAQLQTMAGSEAEKLKTSVKLANQEIQQAIKLSLASFHDANDMISQAARDIMGNIFAKREIKDSEEDLRKVIHELFRRNSDEKIKKILSMLDIQLKNSMQKPVKTAEAAFTSMLDLMSPPLRKALMERVNLDFDQAKSDVMKLTSHASAQLVEYYDDKAKEPINTAVVEVDELVNELYKADSSALSTLKEIIQDEAKIIQEAVEETQSNADQDVINSVLETGKFLSDEYSAIIELLKKY